MTIIDAHQHFWSKGLFAKAQLPPEMGILLHNYQPEDLKPLLDQSGVEQTVLVQTYPSLHNTTEFLELAEAHEWIAAVVGWVDLTDPEVGLALDSFCAYPKFKGVRHQWEDEPDPAWILRPEVLRGLGEVARRRLTFDLLAKPHNWGSLLRVIDVVPNLDFVIDHIAKPRIHSRQFDDWAAVMARAAQSPRVWVKLSGMITEADWQRWKPSELRPYVDKVMELFGSQRVMFGSDWPVCLLAGTYQQVLETFLENIRDYGQEVQTKLLGENVRKFYRILSCSSISCSRPTL